MSQDRTVEAVSFLLTSVRQLADHLSSDREANDRAIRRLDQELADARACLQSVETFLLDYRDRYLKDAEQIVASDALPAANTSFSNVVPALDLGVASLVDIYRSYSSLLRPYARPCSLSANALLGETDDIDLETSSQGPFWVVELGEGDWYVLPKPGLLERSAQLQNLQRLFHVTNDGNLPFDLELITPASIIVIEYGRRWRLDSKGAVEQVCVTDGPSLEDRLRRLEAKVEMMLSTD